MCRTILRHRRTLRLNSRNHIRNRGSRPITRNSSNTSRRRSSASLCAGGGEGSLGVLYAHVVDADCLEGVPARTVGIFGAAEGDCGCGGTGDGGRRSHADIMRPTDLTVFAVRVGHTANFDGGGGTARRQSSDTNVMLTYLAAGAVRVDHTTNLDRRGRGDWWRSSDADIMLADLSV
jgi:hypothetical protein